jgi:hypothetical protein
MQILELKTSDILLDANSEQTVRFQQINDIIKLRDATLQFNIFLTIPDGQKIVFMNKRGLISAIRLF